jgi:hypothetical protein
MEVAVPGTNATPSEILGTVVRVGEPTDDRIELTLKTADGEQTLPVSGYVALGVYQIVLEGDEVRISLTDSDGESSVVTRVANLTTGGSVSVADAKRAVAP